MQAAATGGSLSLARRELSVRGAAQLAGLGAGVCSRRAQEPPDTAQDIGGTTRSAGSGGVTCACSFRSGFRARWRYGADFASPSPIVSAKNLEFDVGTSPRNPYE